MRRQPATARSSLIAGLVICGLLLGVWTLSSGTDPLGLISFLTRFVHVAGAIVWVGMIWFINFIHLAAMEEADETTRGAFTKLVLPRVAMTFRMASHLVIVSGLLLLATTGYILDRWVFDTTVYVPPLKGWLVTLGAAGGVIMWLIVHLAIWPNVRIVIGEVVSDANSKAKARDRLRSLARFNLMLALPVIFVMIAAAHLY